MHKSRFFENNKGVHIINRKVKLNYLTKKDLQSIKIAKKQKLKTMLYLSLILLAISKNFQNYFQEKKNI